MKRRTLHIGSSYLIAATVVLTGCHRPTPPPPNTAPPIVTVAHPLLDKITLFTDMTGTVDSENTVDIYPRVSGYIKEVKFEEGKEVKKDQVLFLIDPVIYEALLGQSEGQVKNYEAQLAKANADLARTKETYDRGATSKTEFDQAIASKYVAAAQLFTAQQSVKQARQNLEWTKVTSPIDGRISRALVKVGSLARADTTKLTTIVEVDPMYAYFDADESTLRMYQSLIAKGKLKSVTEGAKIPVEIQLVGETGYPHKGYLDFVDNRLNPATGSLTIRGEFQNPIVAGKNFRTLTAGLYCKGRIPVGAPFDGILIPPEAVSTDQGKKIVFVLGPENRIELRPVVLGPLSRGLQLVRSGLTEKDLVVIRGLSRVQPGVVVDPQEEKIVSKEKPEDVPEGNVEMNPADAPQPRESNP
jgi:multidrug efflux system membrane fusion protein